MLCFVSRCLQTLLSKRRPLGPPPTKAPTRGPYLFLITEARSEGLIELQLVRKPPKVSRGYGGVARAARVAADPGEAYRCRGAACLVVQVSQILAFVPMEV